MNLADMPENTPFTVCFADSKYIQWQRYHRNGQVYFVDEFGTLTNQRTGGLDDDYIVVKPYREDGDE